MTNYTFYFFDRQDRIPYFDFSEQPDDGSAARAAASRLRQRREAKGVEIHDGARLVLRFSRDEDVLGPD